MKTTRFEVLSSEEVARIHAASMEILAEVGIKVNYKKARELFCEAGADVNDETLAVKLPEKLIRWAVDQAQSASLSSASTPNSASISDLSRPRPSLQVWERPRAYWVVVKN